MGVGNRWAGLYGVDADFVAEKNCKICTVSVQDIKASKIISPAPSSVFTSCLQFVFIFPTRAVTAFTSVNLNLPCLLQ
jgi:hypothetical protein